MPASARKSNPQLWSRVKAKVTHGSKGGDPGQWSARKAQMAMQEYKKRGGGYVGARSASNHLAKWTKAHASDTASGGQQTRAQLYQQAQRLKIPGRSTMTKADLQRAIGRKRK